MVIRKKPNDGDAVIAQQARQRKPSETVRWDKQVPGLGLRRCGTGEPSWIVHYRERGRQRKLTLGPRASLTREEARKQARGVVGEAAVRLALADPRVAKGEPPRFDACVETWWRAQRTAWKPATQRTSRRFVDREFLPAFGHLRIDDVDRAAVMRWRDGLRATPGNANRALPVLSRIFDHAERCGWRPRRSNPCARVTRFATTRPDRFLADEEVARLGRAMRDRATPPLVAAFVRLALLTGARKGELLGLEWDWIDGPRAALPDSKTGARVIHLSAAALRVLSALPRRSRWVFPNRAGDRPPPNFDAAWNALRRRAGLEDVRLHDLRHSFASIAIAHGESAAIVGRLLGHALPESTQRYIHFAREDVGRAATRIAGRLARALGERETGDGQA